MRANTSLTAADFGLSEWRRSEWRDGCRRAAEFNAAVGVGSQVSVGDLVTVTTSPAWVEGARAVVAVEGAGVVPVSEVVADA